MLAGMAQFYSDNLATEVIKGAVQKAKSGGRSEEPHSDTSTSRRSRMGARRVESRSRKEAAAAPAPEGGAEAVDWSAWGASWNER